MKDFKSIDELNIFECCEIVKEGEGHPFFNLVKTRFDQELMVLKEEEKKDFELCKNSTDYERFLSKYRQYTAFYSMQYEKKAEDALDNLYWQSMKTTLDGCQSYLSLYPHGIYCHEARQTIDSFKRKRLWAKVISIVVLLVALTIAFFVGYEPADYISLSESSLTFSKYGDTKSVKISTNASIYDCGAESSDYWITISKSEYDVMLTVKPNPNAERNGHVTFYAYSTLYGNSLFCKEITIPVRQDSGKPSYLKISKGSFEFNKKGTGVGEFFVETDGVNISTDCSKDWVHISHNDHVSSNTKYKITVDMNEGGYRSTYVHINVGDFEQSIFVSQESGRASYLSLSRDEIRPVEEGTQPGRCYAVDIVTDGATWSAHTSYSWLTLTSLQDRNKLEIKVAENTGEVRTGYVTVSTNNGDISETITVTQSGKPSKLSLSRSEINMDTDADYEYVQVNRDGSYPIEIDNVSGGNWLSASVSGDRLKVSCSKNNSGARSGSVRVKCGNRTVSLSVKQKGWRSCWRCGGNGSVQCPYAGLWNGNYHYIQEFVMYNYYQGGYQQRPCPHCGGSGSIKCPDCNGRGKFKTN